MNRLHQVLIIAAISVLALAGCNSAEQSTTQTSPAASSASPVEAAQQTASSAAAAKGGFDGLLSVVSTTNAAVEAGNFANAKQEFEKFEDVWKNVEDGVKAKSPDGYKAIEGSMDEVMGALKGSGQNKEKALAALQSLEKNITGVAKL